MTVRNRVLRAAVLGVVLALTAIAPGSASSAPALSPFARHVRGPIVIRHIRDGIVSSTNWSGYAVTGANGSVSDAKGSWIVPTVTCGSTASQYSSFWVGIDGFNSSTVEQIGTDADCVNGAPTYYAWFELYPHPMFTVNTLHISPGDVIAAEVSYGAGRQFTLTIRDVMTGQSFSTSAKVRAAHRSSAEWIAEAPSSGGGILPLADFGIVDFGQDTTKVASTCVTTVNGTAGTIGGFGAAVQQITMVSSGGATKAQPSALSADGSSFSDTWVSAGP